jgi:hypothetical protein
MQVLRKKTVAAIAILLLVIMGSAAVIALTWTSRSIEMTASTGDVIALALFSDPAATRPFVSFDWGSLSQGQTYEATVYVKNTGNKAILLTYLSKDMWFYDNQAHFTLNVFVGSIQVQEKGPPGDGYPLAPGAIAKLTLRLWVDMLVAGGTYDFSFTVYGVTQEL